VPDLTFLLELDAEAAARRAGERDRFEDEGAALQHAVLEAYERVVAADPARWRRVDATRSPEQVHADVLAEVEAARSGARA
jgi:dTMP kinase